ncbi:unnamed protein product [Mytilus edulis]|uniref:Uncharacterized protein n=1 Tax=Mytilus edulis TaxID=6550 RepID=A0A8S3V5V2_MYTED|nr:unnamed protein product [Mytilus edulis]
MENSIEKKFHDEIIKLCDDNKSSNNSIFTRERYRETIGNVKEAKLSSKKTALQRYFLRQYDVLSVAGIEKLIRKGGEIFYYCTVDELYPLIRTAHSGVGHGGIHKTYKELKNNLPISAEKSRTETTKLVVRPITSTDFNSRCQVDLVDYQSCPDGEYKWIMHYQDHLTKFSVLRPLKTKRAAEVAYQLTDIFLLLGAPHILGRWTNGGDSNFGASNLPLRGNKVELWEGGSKSVGFVYSPRFLKHKGCVHEGMMHAVDWFPTILDMAGFNKGKRRKTFGHIDAVSQWKYLKRCRGSGRNEFVYQIDDYVAKSAAIRVGDYKLILGEPRVVDFSLDPNGGFTIKLADPNSTDIRLFNLKNDPTESNNLASRLPKKVKKMKMRLDELRRDSLPTAFPVFESNEIGSPNNIVSIDWCSV